LVPSCCVIFDLEPLSLSFDLVFNSESSIHLLDQNRYSVDTRLIHIEFCKSPTAVLFDVDTGRISIRHCEILKSITLNVLARSQG
ncbi:hypothetical protein Tco_1469982, partial [Tanacetum coccineum]